MYSEPKMIALGYLYETVSLRPTWVTNTHVLDLYYISRHASPGLQDVNFWKHNGY